MKSIKKILQAVKNVFKIVSASFNEELEDFERNVRRDANYYK